MRTGFDSMIDKMASVSGSVMTVLLLKPLLYGVWNKHDAFNFIYNIETISSSVIAGIASISGASGYVEIHSAMIIGSIGGIVYLIGSLLLRRF